MASSSWVAQRQQVVCLKKLQTTVLDGDAKQVAASVVVRGCSFSLCMCWQLHMPHSAQHEAQNALRCKSFSQTCRWPNHEPQRVQWWQRGKTVLGMFQASVWFLQQWRLLNAPFFDWLELAQHAIFCESEKESNKCRIIWHQFWSVKELKMQTFLHACASRDIAPWGPVSMNVSALTCREDICFCIQVHKLWQCDFSNGSTMSNRLHSLTGKHQLCLHDSKQQCHKGQHVWSDASFQKKMWAWQRSLGFKVPEKCPAWQKTNITMTHLLWIHCLLRKCSTWANMFFEIATKWLDHLTLMFVTWWWHSSTPFQWGSTLLVLMLHLAWLLHAHAQLNACTWVDAWHVNFF